MDRKAIIQALLWASIAFLIFSMLSKRLLPQIQPGPDATPATTQPAADPVTTTAAGPSPSVSSTAPVVTPSGAYRVAGASEPMKITIGNADHSADNPFRNGLITTNVGAATEEVIVTDFAATVGSKARYILLRPFESVDGSQLYSLAMEGININGENVPLADALWNGRKEKNEEVETAHYTLDIVDTAGQPVLRLARVYRIQLLPADEGRYDVSLDLQATNLTDQSLDVRFTQRGPIGVQQEYSRADSRYTFAAVSTAGVADSLDLDTVQYAKVGGGDTSSQLLFKPGDTGENLRFWWSGAGNKYFSCVVVPLPGEGQPGVDNVIQAEAVDLDRDKETTDDITTRWVTRAVISPGTEWRCPQQCYFGPNDGEAFSRTSNEDYVRWGFDRIVAVQYTWCTFSWLTQLLTILLDGLYRIVRNYGVAIIILVLVVRVLLHPITKKGQVNMVRMQERMSKLQPKIEQLKEKYGNDRTRLQQEQMKLYQDEGISPFTSMLGSCAPMAIQMPIWVALYTSLSNNIHMRHQPFVLWINDLTAPDALVRFSEAFNIPLLGALTGPIEAINVLPVLMGVTMYLQQKLMPKPKTETPAGSTPQMDQAAQMQKMMPIMSAFFVLIFYAMPSGLNLYIMTSSLFGMIEQWQIRKHIKAEKEKAGQAADTPAAGPPKGPPQPKKPPSWLTRKFQEIQKQAEDAQRVQSKRKKPR